MNDDAQALEGLSIGVVPYLNVEPMKHGLDVAAKLRPADLAIALERGEIDLATLPVGALVGRSDWAGLPSTGIGTEGPVRTVLLEPLDALDTADGFRPDPASRTSNLLARLLLGRRRGRDVPPAADSPLRVVIGDPAFAIDPGRSLDMGTAWKEWTGLPFVFALWVAGPRLSSDPSRMVRVDRALRAHAEEGMRNLDEICHRQVVVDPETAHFYLTRNLQLLIDERFRRGADRFAMELERAGLSSGGIRWAC